MRFTVNCNYIITNTLLIKPICGVFIMNLFDSLELTESKLEHAANMVGHVPLLSTFSGGMRLAGSVIQAKAGLIGAIASTLGSAIGAMTGHENLRDNGLYAAGKSLEQIGHGIGNAVRGSVEVIPIINLLTIPYDIIGARYKYDIETKVESKMDFSAQMKELLEAHQNAAAS